MTESAEGAPDGADHPAAVPQVDVGEAARRHAGGAFVVDVRTAEEYREAHVPGAHLLPIHELEERHREVPTDREVLVICKSGGRSAVAVAALNQAGYRTVNVVGGTLAWIDAGHPVARGTEG